MRAIIRAAIVFVILGVAYWGWALIGAAQLASAASRGDADALLQRVDMPLLSRSLSRQISYAWLRQNPKFAKLAPLEQGFVRSAGTDAANAVLQSLLTPENIAALLKDGRAGFPGAPAGESVWRAPSFSEAFQNGSMQTIASSHFDGPLSFVVPLDGPDGRYGVHLRLSGATWRLSGLDVPEEVSARLAREIAQRVG